MPILRVAANPFHVLCLSTDASHDDVERRVETLLKDLAEGAAGADTFATPLGPRPRTAALVTWACKQLRDPDKRLHSEVWYFEPVDRSTPTPTAMRERPQAWRAFGWRAR